MKKSILYVLSLMTALGLAATNVYAEDIDIFGAASANGVAPNILILVDNTSSNDAAYASACPYTAAPASLPNSNLLDMVYCALYGTLEAIKTNGLAGKLNVGLMVGGSGSNKGGEMSYPSTPPYNLPLMNAAGIAAFQATISAGIPKATGNAKLDGDMTEVWAWLTGHTGPRSGTSYASHVGTGTLSCQKTFLILVGAAAKQGRPCNGSGCGSASELGAAGATPAQQAIITTSGTLSAGSWIDEWARFLYGTDFNSTTSDTQNLITYTIAAGGTDADYTALLNGTAKAGGGKPFVGTDYASMADAFLKIFNEVASVNSVFSSVSLPISSSTQGTFDDKIFVGMFRPEATGGQRWMGNLKQYKFGLDMTNPLKPTLFLSDANGNDAISSTGSGFISPNAVSFWNQAVNTSVLPDSLGGFWVNNKSGTPLSGYDNPDGEVVEKGGAGFRLRLDNLQDNYVANPATPRNVYTCVGSSCAASAHLNTMKFATNNAALTSTVLGINNPVYTSNVSSIARVSSTGIVTITLPSAPSPAITDATTVTISGSAGGQFNYNLAGKSPTASGTTVTYSLPQELPPTSLTTPANWTVTGSAAGLSNVSSLTRSTNAGQITATATLADLTFGGSTTAAAGESVVIANSTGYNGTGTITTVDTVLKKITFTMSETPSVYGGGGQVSVGSSNCETRVNKTPNCDSIGTSNTNPPGAQNTLPGLVRGTNCGGCGVNSGKILMVNIPNGTAKFTAVVPANGVKAYIQSGALPANYVNTSTGYSIVGVGASCSVTETHTDGSVRTYTGTATSGTTYYTLCLDLGASFVTTPGAANGATASPQTTATRVNSSFSRTISTLARGASSCTGTGSGATANNATVTVTTTLAHPFTVGEVVQISSGSPGLNESAYIGSATIVSATSTQFTYTIGTTPACKDTTSGMTITYQSSVGGTDPNDLIRWVRGFDNVGDEQSPGSTITIRPSVHGDVLHSRPAAVNYGSSTGIVVFYGSNDGMFHAVNGNQTGNIAGVEPGGELWSFIPSEFFSKLQRAYSNSPPIHLLGTPAGITPTPTQRDYFFDGPTGFYPDTVNNKMYIYLTAHRGGRIIYALDVTDPADPLFMWKFGGCPNLTDNNNCPSGAPTELGQTWSVPKAAPVKGYSNPILIFGAGYYGGYTVDSSTGNGSYYGEDAEPPGTNNLMGRGIFILDAITGAKIWQAGPGGSTNTCIGVNCQLKDMKYAMPADLILLDQDRPTDGVVDRAYASDVGGNIWRIDFEPTGGNAPANWQVTQFASLGGATTDTTRRKFLFPPDVVFTKDFDIVLAGTGDREHPAYDNSITRGIVNRFYMLKDTQSGKDANAGTAWSPIVDDTSATTDTLVSSTMLYHVDTTTTPPGAYPSTFPAHGFYVTMPNAGEKFANGPSTIGGDVFFGTNTPKAPDANSCSNGTGDARGYEIDILTGETHSVVLDGGGLPPSPVTGLVNIPLPGGGTITMPFQIGAGGPNPGPGEAECKSVFCPPPVNPKIGAKRSRVYWYIDKHDRN